MEDSQMKIREAKEESQIKESAKQIRDKKQDIKFDVRDYPINYLVSQYEKQEFYIPLVVGFLEELIETVSTYIEDQKYKKV